MNCLEAILHEFFVCSLHMFPSWFEHLFRCCSHPSPRLIATAIVLNYSPSPEREPIMKHSEALIGWCGNGAGTESEKTLRQKRLSIQPIEAFHAFDLFWLIPTGKSQISPTNNTNAKLEFLPLCRLQIARLCPAIEVEKSLPQLLSVKDFSAKEKNVEK